MKKINIGLIGFGTIGSGVVKALRTKHGYIKNKYGLDLCLEKICDKNLAIKRSVPVPKSLLTKNAYEIINDPKIDIVIELIGAIEPAKKFIISSLKNKKHVITANKALLSVAKKELFAIAWANHAQLKFEASVCGGIPIIKALSEGLSANSIQSIRGIVNGTCNYILSEMEDSGIDFLSALKQAQDKGYAEKNPSLDIKGLDSAHKLAILASLSFGIDVLPRHIYTEGITEISADDIKYAGNFGYAIKLLAIAKKAGKELEVRVHPALVPKQHPLASVKSNFNAVSVKADMIGETLFYGRGSGSAPTASAVLSDIIDLALDIKNKNPRKLPAIVYDKQVSKIKTKNDFYCSYYIRFHSIDKPGVLASISKILSQHKISIASVSQKARKEQKIVPIIMLTHKANEMAVARALRKIDALSVIKKKSVVIREE